MSPVTSKIALVIGAAGGIGGETAAALIRHGWSVRGLTRRPQPGSAPKQIAWIPGDAMNAADVLRAAQGASLIVHAANPPGYRNWATQVLPMVDNTIAAAKAVGARITLPGTVNNFGPDAFPVLREDAPSARRPARAQSGWEMERRLRAAACGADALSADCARLRLFWSVHDRHQLILGGDGAAWLARQGDHRPGAARRQPRLGLSSRCRRDDRAADGSRERTWRFRGLSFRRPSTCARRNGGGDPQGDGQATPARLVLPLASCRRPAAFRAAVPRNGGNALPLARDDFARWRQAQSFSGRRAAGDAAR